MSVIIAERFSKVFAAMKLLALERWPEGDLKSDELRVCTEFSKLHAGFLSV